MNTYSVVTTREINKNLRMVIPFTPFRNLRVKGYFLTFFIKKSTQECMSRDLLYLMTPVNLKYFVYS